MTERDLARDLPVLLQAHPAVQAVELVGSRARGEATAMSDWDFVVHLADPADLSTVTAALPALVAPIEPIATLWDPLSDHHVLALILAGTEDGPVKIDLVIVQPHDRQPPWQPSADTLQQIDTHFWDWTLWLAGKQHAGRHELVATELATLSRHLLRPLGVPAVPADLGEAVATYRAARDDAESRFGVRVDRRLEHTVAPTVLRVAGAPS